MLISSLVILQPCMIIFAASSIVITEIFKLNSSDSFTSYFTTIFGSNIPDYPLFVPTRPCLKDMPLDTHFLLRLPPLLSSSAPVTVLGISSINIHHCFVQLLVTTDHIFAIHMSKGHQHRPPTNSSIHLVHNTAGHADSFC
jgi:hypothetical protein